MTLLWADDEIDLLKPHIMFLRGKGYDVETVNSGADALDLAARRHFDLIILDENMPGWTGDPVTDKDDSAQCPGDYDNQKRGGEYHGSGGGQ